MCEMPSPACHDADSLGEEILASASVALGAALYDPIDLGGTDRTSVLRCQSRIGSVVVKAFRDRPDALAAYANEAAALSLGVGPDLLAIDRSRRVLVMEDLGVAPSLVDLLLGNDSVAARNGLVSWAAAVGRLAADTVDRHDEFDTLRERFDTGQSTILGVDRIIERLQHLPAAFAAVNVDAAPGLDAELSGLLGHEYLAFSPGDTCPGNNLMTGEGIRLLDFEGASYRPVFLDAAYLRVPFPTCWCMFRLPSAVAAEAEQAYRTEVIRAYPNLSKDGLWHRGVAGATVAWDLYNTTMIPEVLTGDLKRHPSLPAPTWRQLLRHRWATVATIIELPATAETARRLLAATDTWDTPPLPGYLAFGS